VTLEQATMKSNALFELLTTSGLRIQFKHMSSLIDVVMNGQQRRSHKPASYFLQKWNQIHYTLLKHTIVVRGNVASVQQQQNATASSKGNDEWPGPYAQ
jgi:hypothetical protein